MPVRQIYNHHARKMLWREQQQPVVVVLQNVQLFFCFFFNDSRGYGKVNVHNQTQVMSLLHAVTLFFSFLLRDPLFLPSFARRLVYVRSFVAPERKSTPSRVIFFLLFFSVPNTKRTKRITSKKKPHRRLLSTALSHFCNGRLSKTWPRNRNLKQLTLIISSVGKLVCTQGHTSSGQVFLRSPLIDHYITVLKKEFSRRTEVVRERFKVSFGFKNS
jgi:hypothetical protein